MFTLSKNDWLDVTAVVQIKHFRLLPHFDILSRRRKREEMWTTYEGTSPSLSPSYTKVMLRWAFQKGINEYKMRKKERKKGNTMPTASTTRFSVTPLRTWKQKLFNVYNKIFFTKKSVLPTWIQNFNQTYCNCIKNWRNPRFILFRLSIVIIRQQRRHKEMYIRVTANTRVSF